MFPLPMFRRKKRMYAKRLPPEFVRRAMLSIRVNERARFAIFSLAHARGMSASEYVARLLSEHLRNIQVKSDCVQTVAHEARP